MVLFAESSAAREHSFGGAEPEIAVRSIRTSGTHRGFVAYQHSAGDSRHIPTWQIMVVAEA